MGNIVFTSIGSSGSIFPFLRMGEKLKQRGHRVTVISNCIYGDRAAKAGLDFIPIDTPQIWSEFNNDGVLFNSPQGFKQIYTKYFLPQVRPEFEAIQKSITSEDCVLVARCQPSIAALLAAENLGVPLVSVFLAPTNLSTIVFYEEMFGGLFLDAVNEVRKTLTMPAVDTWNYWLPTPQGCLALWPEWFAGPSPEWPAQPFLSGFVLPEPTANQNGNSLGDLEDFLRRRPILITGGTGMFSGSELFTICTSACERLGRPALLVTQNEDQLPKGTLPPDVRWKKFLPFEQVFPHLSAIVHHGGIGTASQALAAGIPQLVMGAGVDRVDNANLLAKLGVAEYLPPAQWSIDAAADKIQRLASNGVRESAATWRQRLAQEDGTLRACEFIERTMKKPATASVSGATQAQRTRGQPASAAKNSGLRDLIKNLSPEKRALLELRLKQQSKEKPAAKTVVPPARPAGPRRLPLSPSQAALWLADRVKEGNNAYNMPGAIRVRGRLNLATLQEAVNDLVKRHEILRTNFVKQDGFVQQVVHPERSVPLETFQLPHAQNGEFDETIKQTLNTELRRVFDLERDVLVKFKVIEAGPDTFALVINLHHIIFDAWSMSILLRELAALYIARSSGSAAGLPDLAIQFGDYAVRQQEYTSGQGFADAVNYWKEQLRGARGVLELPIEKERGCVRGNEADERRFGLTFDSRKQLTELAQREGTTLNSALLAGVAILLNRYSNQNDLIIGTVASNRTSVDVEGLIGYFINTIPIRIACSGSVRDLLRAVKEAGNGALAHQEVPFDKILGVSEAERRPGLSPLFQTLFNYVDLPEQVLQVGGLSFELVKLANYTTHYDIEFQARAIGDGLSVQILFRKGLFHDEIANAWAEQLQRIYAEMVLQPDCAVKRLPLCEPAETLRKVARCEGPASMLLKGESLIELFEKQALASGANLALIAGEVRLSYAELNRRANQVANYLRAAGAGPDVLVGVKQERSVELITCILGIIKAGAAYVPLHPQEPFERLNEIIADAAIQLIITDSLGLESLPVFAGRVINLTEEASAIEATADANPPSDACPDSLAYVMFTSGSTGKPKGIGATHRGIIRLVKETNYVDISEGDTLLQASSASFDASTFEIWGSLLNGACLVLMPPGVFAADELGEQLKMHQVTTLFLTTSLFRALVREQPQVFAGLKTLLFGGEVLPVSDAVWCQKHVPDVVLSNVYGPTENVTFSTCHRLNGGTEESCSVPIGKCINATQAYILNDELELLVPGIIGEIFLAGDGLARGYYGRPDLTAESFIANPFGDKPGQRMYRTGDLARYRGNGDIEFIGRKDNQVKLRGFRIELNEVEAGLRRCSSIDEAAVLLREEQPGDHQLVAYISPKSGVPFEVGRVREELHRYLPDYMVPGRFCVLDKLPLNRNGKVNRSELPRLTEIVASGVPYRKPEDPRQELLATIWAEVLRVPCVGIDDDFFELGGDSILALIVVGRAKERGLELHVAGLFESPTISGLLARTPHSNGSGATTESFSMISVEDRAKLPAEVEDAYPLSSLQAGMFFHSQSAPESAVYHDVVSHEIRTRWDEEAFRRSVGALIQRHTILRTSFDLPHFSVPLQIVWRTGGDPVIIEDLQQLEADRQRLFVDNFLARERHCGFEWSKSPLLRIFIHVLSPEMFRLTLSFHHAILDGWSLAVLLTELFELYRGRSADGENGSSVPGKLTYRDYISLEQAAVRSPDEPKFWGKYLEGFDFDAAEFPEVCGAANSMPELIRVPVSPELSQQLLQRAREIGVPIKSLLLAVHCKALSVWSGRAEIVTGVAANGRPEVKDGERLPGLFVSVLPFRQALGERRWADLVRAVFDNETALLEHRRFPLALIQKAVGVQKVFNTMYNFTHFHAYAEVVQAPGFELGASTAFEQTDFPLLVNFSLNLSGERVQLMLACDPRRIEAEQRQSVAEIYAASLASVAEEPEAHHARHWLLSAGEKQRVLQASRGLPIALLEECVHELVEKQCAATPNQVAVECDNRSLTYRELNDRAEQIAQWLLSMGSAPEKRVGLCVNRSFRLITALLGVLKSGAAYVPLDPAYPQERLETLLREGQVDLIVTEASVRPRLEPLLKDQSLAAVKILDLDALDDRLVKKVARAKVDPQNTAYVLFTSGSTGVPKGVCVSHHNVAALLSWARNQFDAEDLDGVLASASICFDFSVFEIFVPLVRGGRVVLVENILHLAALPESARIRMINTVPSAMVGLLNVKGVPSSTCLANLGGEALPTSLVDRVYSETAVQRVYDIYGPTECTVLTSWSDRRSGETANIGRPIANARIYILDRWLNPVARGVTGELYLAGPHVARGYFGRPDQTAERFVPNPFEGSGSRMYRTGDLGRFLPDEKIQFVGRNDEQVKFCGHRIELGEIENCLAKIEGVSRCVVMVRDGKSNGKQLVAYVSWHGEPLTTASVRTRLEQKLPHYMVPSHVISLDDMPCLPNGKINRRALPALDVEMSSSAFETPRNTTEELLVEIWRDVMRTDRVGVNDNFFELGGDSILSLQIVARARERNLILSPKLLLEHPTIAELAKMIGQKPENSLPEKRGNGELLLTPIQRWFFGLDFAEPHHFNQGVLLSVKAKVEPVHIQKAFDQITARHEVLRTRFKRVDQQWQPGIVQSLHADRFLTIDLSHVSPTKLAQELESHCSRIQQSLDLEQGPLFRAVWFQTPAPEPPRLLLVGHHLIVDAVSWRILLRELELLASSAVDGVAAPSLAKPVSIFQWAEVVRNYAATPQLRETAGYWTRMARQTFLDVPQDFKRGPNVEASTRSQTETLPAITTEQVLQISSLSAHCSTRDLLVGALAMTFRDWLPDGKFLLDMEGHGRQPLSDEIDLSSSVGWFTCLYPVAFPLEKAAPGLSTFRAAKKQLKLLPSEGLPFGILSCFETEMGAELKTIPKPMVAFNYLGQFDGTVQQSRVFGQASEGCGTTRGSQNMRPHLFEIAAYVLNGQLIIRWEFSANLHSDQTIRALLQNYVANIKRLIEEITANPNAVLIEEDFPLAKLGNREFEVLRGRFSDIEDVYPLSPIQEGMLFHARNTGAMYMVQVGFKITGEFAPAALQEAWTGAAERYSTLRTAFVSEASPPLQVVSRRPVLNWREEDWRNLSPEEQRSSLARFLDKDAVAPFDFSHPPLRFHMIRLSDGAHYFLWTVHHILLDGWSLSLICKHVFETYATLVKERAPSRTPVRPFRDYMQWLLNQDTSAAKRFWTERLACVRKGSHFARRAVKAPTPLSLRAEKTINAGASARLREFARGRHVTLNTLVQAAWAVILRTNWPENDVVFGATVSGRPILHGIESMVGIFINTLPVIVDWKDGQNLVSWYQSLQAGQVEQTNYEYSSLADIQRLALLPENVSLFESILIFQNFPVNKTMQEDLAGLGLHLSDFRLLESRSNYPLKLLVGTGDELVFYADYSDEYFDQEEASNILAAFELLLSYFVEHPEATCRDASAILRQKQLEWTKTRLASIRTHNAEKLLKTRARQIRSATPEPGNGGNTIATIATSAGETFWKNYLKDATFDALAFPKKSGEEKHFVVDHVPITPAVLAGLFQRAGGDVALLKAYLLAAHCKVAATLLGKADVVTGLFLEAPLATVREGLESDAGVLPFRQRLGESTWYEMAQEIIRSESALLEHRRESLAAIENAMAVPSLFDTAFRFSQGAEAFASVSKNGNGNGNGNGTAHAPLENLAFVADFSFDPAKKQLGLKLNCNALRINDRERQLIHGMYEAALSSLAEEPDSHHARRGLLPKPEEERVLCAGRGEQIPIPAKCVHELIEEQCASGPARVAVFWNGTNYTYRELNAEADRIACRLRARGAGPEQRVGVCLTRSWRLIATLVGVLKAGAAYVPLDPGYPETRLRTILAEGNVDIIVTESDVRARLPFLLRSENARKVIDLDVEENVESSAHKTPFAVSPDSPAYILFTSGSTGVPKGVSVPHHAVVSLLAWARNRFDHNDFDGVLASTSVCFDVSVFEIFGPLAHGGRLVLVENFLNFADLDAAAGVRLVSTVPSAMTSFLGVESLPPSVRVACIAGEPLSEALVERIYRETAVKRVHDLYGPTECTVYSTDSHRQPGDVANIGRPLANTNVYILDRWLHPVPAGTLGEIYLSGANVAREYFGQPGHTAERFIPNPFRGHGERMYRTGDLGRYLPDGKIQFSGRSDHQVKVRGYRIELGEVEECLTRVPGVERCLVTVRDTTEGLKQLVAYVSWRGDAMKVDALRERMKQQLPQFMVPSQFVFLTEMPSHPNGKINRDALPPPGLQVRDVAGPLTSYRARQADSQSAPAT